MSVVFLFAAAALETASVGDAAVDPPITAVQTLPTPVDAAPQPQISTPPIAASKSDALTEDIVVTGDRRAPREDPLQAVNVETYKAVQVIDTQVISPLARGYSQIVPSPIRGGVRNFFNNLTEPVTLINDVLQFKFGRATKTFGRFAINSTVGVAGLLDVAKRRPFVLTPRQNGFANTLGYYGIKSGPFLFLPLIGPTTLRDVIGLTLDKLIVPAAFGAPFNRPYYALPAAVVGSLDCRNAFDANLRALREEPNPYAASRAQYLRSREAEIEALHTPDLSQTVAKTQTAAELGCRVPAE